LPRSSSLALVIVAAAAVAGCTRLPEYALPKVEMVDARQLATADGIPYRTLRREDFQSPTPPMDDARHAGRMSAYSCANVVPDGEPLMEIRRPEQRGPFVARPQRIRFVGELDRRCSWWNPDQSGAPATYVLQHEQIHFAIVELAARELTARVQRLAGTGATPADAGAALQAQIDAVFEETLDAMRERHTEFDLETSGRVDPVVQERWLRVMEAELARSSSSAAPAWLHDE
jgi:hypothetical protein